MYDTIFDFLVNSFILLFRSYYEMTKYWNVQNVRFVCYVYFSVILKGFKCELTS